MSDPINHPEHYTSHPSGVECIDNLKGNAEEDLLKAVWYVQRELERRKKVTT